MKRQHKTALALALLLMLTACGSSTNQAEPMEVGPIGILRGTTGLGLVPLMAEGEQETQAEYRFHLADSAQELGQALRNGEMNLACLPVDLAVDWMKETPDRWEILAVSDLGQLCIVENGNAVQSVRDLEGTTLTACGRGTAAETALRYLLAEHGLDPYHAVTINWKEDPGECLAALASGAVTLALLPQPAATVAQSKVQDLRLALDLTEEWAAMGQKLVGSVLVARKDWAKAHPREVEVFLEEAGAAVDWVKEHPSQAAEQIAWQGLLKGAAVAERTLPRCHLVWLTGAEKKAHLAAYLDAAGDMELEQEALTSPEKAGT